MNIEDFFKNSEILFDKLINYGFIKSGDSYLLSKDILNHTFKLNIEISKPKNIDIKVYDLSFDEEYNNYKIDSQTGEFVNTIRSQIQEELDHIKNNCTKQTLFNTKQANRIANLIKNKYHQDPEFIWEKYKGYGIFRDLTNHKWYALIMNILKNKIATGDEEVEILNVKLDELEIKELLTKKGFYQAYHMNKKKWISIILDDTLKDNEIMTYITNSHDLITHKK